MQSQNAQENKKTPLAKTLYNPVEREKLLMRYQGIFKHQIPEFAKRMVTIKNSVKNYSR